ncbi:hypothetical protein [Lawsonibacter sp. JLR.KK007]|uniref:hypothetical protein n=1 Tax=Lawsonibacter sp. JLR.KK007 TaxID=3114293 RepID=UPI002FF37D31
MQGQKKPAKAKDSGQSMETPPTPHGYAKVVVTGKSVVLVRHHYAKTGDVEEIFNAYLEEKTGEK